MLYVVTPYMDVYESLKTLFQFGKTNKLSDRLFHGKLKHVDSTGTKELHRNPNWTDYVAGW